MNFADHLWQSTAFALAAGALTLALSSNRARVRHWLWFAASVKFLLPLTLLISLGSQIEWKTPPVQPAVAAAVTQFVEPFTVQVVSTPAPTESALPAILLAFWVLGVIGISCSWLIRWRRIRNTVRRATPLSSGVMVSDTDLEPGVFGIFRPVLVLPKGILDRLPPAQLNAIIAHEMCHIRHRDNLLAAIHMFVETIFWFHPLVWWIGKRMVEERERACDEEVLGTLGPPRAYAEGILNVCKLYVESPLKCVSGVTGADLKKRIEAIMRNRVGLTLSLPKKAALALAGILALSLPIMIGTLIAQVIPKFEVATIKPATAWSPAFKFPSAGRLSVGGENLAGLISYAYDAGLGSNKEITGGPGWIDRDLYSVEAKADGSPSVAEYQLMVRSLLAERFALKVHTVQKTADVYALVLATSDGKPGPGIQPFPGECGALRMPVSNTTPKQAPKQTSPTEPTYTPLTESSVPPLGCRVSFGGPGGIALEGAPMAFLARMLSTQSAILGRPVVDRTGLTGRYNIRVELEFPPLARTNGQTQSPELFAPSLFEALRKQLGLKLEGSKGAVEMIVIDSVERPSEN